MLEAFFYSIVCWTCVSAVFYPFYLFSTFLETGIESSHVVTVGRF